MDYDDNKEVALTYEMLYELMRREKSRQDLQELDPKFFHNLVTYLKEKEVSYKEAGYKNDLFSINERDRLHTELQNIRRLVKELYERREKKMIDMAVNRSRTNANIVDTTNLLAQEKPLFESMVSVLDQYRNSILGNVLALQPLPQSTIIDAEPTTTETTAPEIQEPATAEPSSETQSPQTPTTIVEEANSTTEQPSKKNVKFKQAVPEVVGLDLETYGPFEPDQTAELPSEIADILIEKGEAEELTTPKPL